MISSFNGNLFDIMQPIKDLPHVDVDKISCEQGHLPMKGDCLKKPYKNVVLEHIYRSLNDNGGGIKGCIHDVLECYPDMDRLMQLKVCVGSTIDISLDNSEAICSLYSGYF